MGVKCSRWASFLWIVQRRQHTLFKNVSRFWNRQEFEMSATKVMYLMKHGIAVYAKDDLNSDIDGRPFTFHFCESTNQQVKEQYHGYFTFYSTIEKSFVTAFCETFFVGHCSSPCGTLFVGHCSSPDLLKHFYKFFEENHLSVKLLLNIGMDGPNVNFQKPANSRSKGES